MNELCSACNLQELPLGTVKVDLISNSARPRRSLQARLDELRSVPQALPP